MSRIATGERPLVMKPSNNVYTVLAVVATLVNIICFLVLLMRFTAVFGDKANLFSTH
ncbi:MAG: hypothetical protein ABSB33_06225 [Tepidisphaeraceae bacterium]|jgi:hypothetical protein